MLRGAKGKARAAIGVVGSLLLSLAQRSMNWATFKEALLELKVTPTITQPHQAPNRSEACGPPGVTPPRPGRAECTCRAW